MTLRDYNLCKTLIQYGIIKHRKDYLEEMYINDIKSFFNDNISHVNFQFGLIPQVSVLTGSWNYEIYFH